VIISSFFPLYALSIMYLTTTISLRIGAEYMKALYREYTDDTFRILKPRPVSGYLCVGL